MSAVYKREKKKLIHTLVTLGTEGITDEETLNRVTFVNKFCLFVALAMFVITPVICYFSNWQMSLVLPFSIVFLLNWTVLIFSYHKMHRVAAMTVYFLQCVAISYFGVLLGGLLKLEFTIVLLISITYLIFKDRALRRIAVGMAFVNLIVLEIGYYRNGTQSAIQLSYNEAFVIHVMVVVALICLTILVSKPYVVSNDTRNELKRANHFIKIFVAQVTHELRAPLNTLFQIAKLMRGEVNKDPHLKKIEHLVDLSLVASNTGRNIVGNVLDMAKIESGKIDSVSRETFLIEPFFSKLTAVNEILAQMQEVKLRLSISNMPSIIVSDPFSLTQIFTNILVNAIKYGKKRGIVSVEILRIENDRWQLKVTNEGVGIAPDKMGSIFEPYVTARTGYTEGTGLGLFIVKRKVEAMNGTIEAKSIPGQYTTFTVTLPLVEGRVSNLPLEEWGNELKTEGRNLHVMLAEDKKMIAMVMTQNLEELNFKVTTVNSGFELIKAAEENVPDIIILDYFMPDMNGEETIGRLKSNFTLKDIPIIASSADIYGGVVNRMMIAGADTYIEKDIDPQALQQIIFQYSRKRQVNFEKR